MLLVNESYMKTYQQKLTTAYVMTYMAKCYAIE